MIPKKLHFIYGLSQDFGGKPFSFCHWAAIRSAQINNPDYETHFWYHYKPETFYFQDLESSLISHKIDLPTEVFGNPIPHVAHKTDFLRLKVLNEFGGVYQDLDTITVKSFDSLLKHNFVIAQETMDGETIGLCNAVILAEPNNPFIEAWLEKFRGFRSRGRDEFWNESAVLWPWQLYSTKKYDITVLPPESFLMPDWSQNGLDAMFIKNEQFPEAFTHHLWETFSWNVIRNVNERNFTYFNHSYSNIMKRLFSGQVGSLVEGRQNRVREILDSKRACLNVGCGTKFLPDFVNTDLYPQTGADFLFNCEKDQWPFEDSTFDHVLVSHGLEHLSLGIEHFFKELYRTSKNGAIIEVNIPHPRHDGFLQDPTHQHSWLPESFDYFDLSKCKEWYFKGGAKKPLAVYWNIDFKVLDIEQSVSNSDTPNQLAKSFNLRTKSYGDLTPFLNNTIGEIKIKLQCVK